MNERTTQKVKIALGIEYQGSNYHGWQYQKLASNIQEKVERALSIIANHVVEVYCAGRTDSGVHSTGQVVHFYTSSIRNYSSWTVGVNHYLPKDISILWKQEVPECFHARHSAISRRYRYIIYNYKCRSSIFFKGLYSFYKKLDVFKMNRAAQYLVGEHDFTSFQAINCQSITPIRKILFLKVYSIRRLVIIDIVASSFLYRMVRNIVGCLIEIGISKYSEYWIKELLSYKDRRLASPTAKSEGLYLVDVKYPNIFNLPHSPIGPFFIYK
ncbi:tRNA pseudouridine(38-40) synthase TruA [Buchnera aphidicola]|uniref:tRNA pseudouridine synthase A n=1 Tax=Buchnera aphidicola subsp. Melaphis rhois TaxID=118103 RepID=A0A4D6Y2U6_BUCMH|nr:tRNA pseudouridine(38-40) synthase TruA [Buchnera aphidicola]QCI23219.1 tRNA pseudouridine(38-40) synthase TruA [Buchnera aphidicola (Melaphis rhois)]